METTLSTRSSSVEERKEILLFAQSCKLLIGEGALDVLAARSDWKELVSSFEKENTFIVEREVLEDKIRQQQAAAKPKPARITEVSSTAAKRTQADFRILSEYDVTGHSETEGTIKDFLEFFRNKFKTLSALLKSRHTLSPKPLNRLRTVPKNREVDLIGMVGRIWTTKNSHHAFELEDLQGRAICLILKDERGMDDAKRRLGLDDVVAVRATRIGDELAIAREIYWPDLSQRMPAVPDTAATIAHLSDMHVGSRLFLERPFNKFLDWINGRAGDEKERKEAARVKYVVVTGDNVDGIGVYPDQYDELSVQDISKQYALFSDLILQIPSHIEIFITPGNHDAVRVGEPQPALPEHLVPKLAEADNVHLVGSPSWVEIEGLLCLLYHGSGIHGLFSAMSGLSYEKPSQAVIELLKKRDLMPAYGMRQPFVPEKRDYMLVHQEPDLVFVGDLHHVDYGRYRGTTVLNGATWQARTDYQIKLGHVPTPGILPVLELSTGKVKEYQFYRPEEDLHAAL